MATTSRPSYVAAIYLVACCTIAFAAEPPAKDDKSKPPTAKPPIIESIKQETAASPAAVAEIKKLVGNWYVVEHVQENEQAGAKILKLVVTPKTFLLADTGSSYPPWVHYRLDHSHTPTRPDPQDAPVAHRDMRGFGPARVHGQDAAGAENRRRQVSPASFITSATQSPGQSGELGGLSRRPSRPRLSRSAPRP